MDFTYLVESGKYTKDMLNEQQLAFIKGIETAIEEIELWIANECCDEDTEEIPIYESVMNSIKEEAARKIIEWVESSRNTYIVTFADDNADREMYE